MTGSLYKMFCYVRKTGSVEARFGRWTWVDATDQFPGDGESHLPSLKALCDRVRDQLSDRLNRSVEFVVCIREVRQLDKLTPIPEISAKYETSQPPGLRLGDTRELPTVSRRNSFFHRGTRP